MSYVDQNLYKEPSPEWWVFTRLFVKRHNNFMYYAHWSFLDVLNNFGITCTERGSNLYFSTDRKVIDVIPTSDYDYIVKHKSRILRLLLDCTVATNLKLINRFDEEEIKLLSIALNFRMDSLLLSSSDSCF